MKTKTVAFAALLLVSAADGALAQGHGWYKPPPGAPQPAQPPQPPQAPQAPQAQPAPAASPQARGDHHGDGGQGGGRWSDRQGRPGGQPGQPGPQPQPQPQPPQPAPQTQDRRFGDGDRRERRGGGWYQGGEDRRGDDQRRDWDRDQRDRGDWQRRDGDRDHRDRDRDRDRDHDRDRDRGRWDGDRSRWDGPRWAPHVYPPTYRSERRFRGYGWSPPRGYYYRAWRFGEVLPRGWYGPEYRLLDWWNYDLPEPPPGLVWVRVGADVLLVEDYSGRIVQVVRYVFW